MATDVQATRANIYGVLNNAREELLAAIDGLKPELMAVPVLGDWSVKDIVTHVTSWEELILLDLNRLKRGRIPARYHEATDKWNETLMSVRRGFPLDQVLAELGETRDALMKALDEVADDQFAAGDVPGSCQITALHDWEHARQIKEWRSQQGV